MKSLPPAPNLPMSPAPALFQELARDDIFRLETSRLWLRWPKLADVAALSRHAGDYGVAEMTDTIPHPYPHGAADKFVFSVRKGNALGQMMTLAIITKDRPQELIGMIGARPGTDGEPVFGYWLGVEHWGKGYATEAAQAMIDAVFTLTSAAMLEAHARIINPASRRVLEKCGFHHTGSHLKNMPARGGLLACDQFRLERKTWAGLRNWAALKSWAIPLLQSERADMPQTVHAKAATMDKSEASLPA